MSLPRVSLPGGLSCSILGLGTMGFGGKFERDDNNDAQAIRIIDRALDLGINLFDTGEVYAAGHCERNFRRSPTQQARQGSDRD